MKVKTRKIGILCSLAYIASYLLRLGFAAGLVAITADLGISHENAGLACTGLFITYGLGQFISGWLGDRVAPRRLISFGLLGACVCNLALMGACQPALLVAIWCVNGFMHALIWPPMTRLIADALDEQGYLRATKMVSVSANLATMFVYALMSSFVRLRFWRGYFILAAVFGVGVVALFNIGMRKMQAGGRIVMSASKPAKEKASSKGMGKIVVSSGIPLIMVGIALQGMLRDGVTTWMPTLIVDTTHLDAAASILSVAIMPLFSVMCINIASAVRRKLGDDVSASALLCFIGALSAAAILPFLGRNAICVIILSAVLNGCMHAMNFLLTCYTPNYFAPYGKVSTMAGIVNSCVYVGSASSTYGIALLSSRYGWTFTVGIWAGIAALGALFCLAAVGSWRRFTGVSRQKSANA